jgi:hypothetical protein
MPQVGFEPMIPVLERVKRVHALDRAAIIIEDITNIFTADRYLYGTNIVCPSQKFK